MTAVGATGRGRFFELSADLLCVGRIDGVLVDVNGAWQDTLGWSPPELCGRSLFHFVHPDDLDRTSAEISRLGDGDLKIAFENRCRRRDGGFVWLSWSVAADPEGEEQPGPQRMYAVARDVTAAKHAELALEHLAHHDALTGLWNRRRFDDELVRQVARCRRYDERAALLLLDLDDFKSVNDTYGHQVGDDLIRHVGSTLDARLRASDSLARVGGDEFAILLPQVSPDQAARTVEALETHLRGHPLDLGRDQVCVTASIGMAVLDGHLVTPHDAMLAADVAMYEAKAARDDRVRSTKQDPDHSASEAQTQRRGMDDAGTLA